MQLSNVARAATFLQFSEGSVGLNVQKGSLSWLAVDANCPLTAQFTSPPVHTHVDPTSA